MTTKEAQIALANLKLYISGGGAVDRGTNKAIDMAIRTLEKPEPHWIPVTERLPKPRESVIISVNGKYGDWIGEGCYWETTENHVIWKGYRWNATYWDDEIIAWMPLPEAYKGVTT